MTYEICNTNAWLQTRSLVFQHRYKFLVSILPVRRLAEILWHIFSCLSSADLLLSLYFTKSPAQRWSIKAEIALSSPCAPKAIYSHWSLHKRTAHNEDLQTSIMLTSLDCIRIRSALKTTAQKNFHLQLAPTQWAVNDYYLFVLWIL